jgi:GxxExxY protein
MLDGWLRMPIHPHDERTYQIIGSAMEVHRILHRGLKERLYCDALGVEFELRRIPFARAVPCRLVYKNRELGGFYFIDFVCFDDVVVEVKATSALTPADEAQILNYLALLGKRVGLLLNFGAKSLQYQRFVLDRSVE